MEKVTQLLVMPLWLAATWGHAYFRAWHEALETLR